MITNQPECAECGGACCEPERLGFPVPMRHVRTFDEARNWLANMGLPDAELMGIYDDQHGKRTLRTDCPRRGNCDETTRPEPCLSFPEHYLNRRTHSDAERDEVREFCALFRRLEQEREDA